MAKKKSDQDDKSTEQKALERKVDAMMSVEGQLPEETEPEAKPEPKSKPAKVIIEKPVEDPVPDQSTAPQLPPQLLKTIGSRPAKSSLKIIKTKSDEESSEILVKLTPKAETPKTEVTSTEPEPEQEPLATDDPLEDTVTDKAVDSIVAEEANMQLAVDDAVARRKAAEAEGHGPGVVYRFFISPWTWLFIIGIAAVTYAWYH
jgi:hypothetical protein